MRHLKSGRKLSRRKGHRDALFANLASSLIMHGRIETTEPKAKELRPIVERMVSFARKGDLHSRRVVLSRLKDPAAVKKLFDEIGPRYVSRPGGYTRILKLGYRLGDNASVALIEFVQEEEEKKEPKKAKTVKSKAKTTKPATETKKPVEETESEPAAEKQETEIPAEEETETEKPEVSGESEEE